MWLLPLKGHVEVLRCYVFFFLKRGFIELLVNTVKYEHKPNWKEKEKKNAENAEKRKEKKK